MAETLIRILRKLYTAEPIIADLVKANPKPHKKLVAKLIQFEQIISGLTIEDEDDWEHFYDLRKRVAHTWLYNCYRNKNYVPVLSERVLRYFRDTKLPEPTKQTLPKKKDSYCDYDVYTILIINLKKLNVEKSAIDQLVDMLPPNEPYFDLKEALIALVREMAKSQDVGEIKEGIKATLVKWQNRFVEVWINYANKYYRQSSTGSETDIMISDDPQPLISYAEPTNQSDHTNKYDQPSSSSSEATTVIKRVTINNYGPLITFSDTTNLSTCAENGSLSDPFDEVSPQEPNENQEQKSNFICFRCLVVGQHSISNCPENQKSKDDTAIILKNIDEMWIYVEMAFFDFFQAVPKPLATVGSVMHLLVMIAKTRALFDPTIFSGKFSQMVFEALAEELQNKFRQQKVTYERFLDRLEYFIKDEIAITIRDYYEKIAEKRDYFLCAVQCGYCHLYGHVWENCYEMQTKMFCDWCFEFGHFNRMCSNDKKMLALEDLFVVSPLVIS